MVGGKESVRGIHQSRPVQGWRGRLRVVAGPKGEFFIGNRGFCAPRAGTKAKTGFFSWLIARTRVQGGKAFRAQTRPIASGRFAGGPKFTGRRKGNGTLVFLPATVRCQAGDGGMPLFSGVARPAREGYGWGRALRGAVGRANYVGETGCGRAKPAASGLFAQKVFESGGRGGLVGKARWGPGSARVGKGGRLFASLGHGARGPVIGAGNVQRGSAPGDGLRDSSFVSDSGADQRDGGPARPKRWAHTPAVDRGRGPLGPAGLLMIKLRQFPLFSKKLLFSAVSLAAPLS